MAETVDKTNTVYQQTPMADMPDRKSEKRKQEMVEGMEQRQIEELSALKALIEG